MSNILTEANELISKDRAEQYGSYADGIIKHAKLATIVLGKEILPTDIAMINILGKLTRESFKHKRDNLTDLCGYTALYSTVVGDVN